MSDTILQFDDVSVRYSGSITALSGVSLTVRQGEIAALLGGNGAGKTTLLKAASNLLPAERGRITGGRITFRGEDVTRTSPDAHIRKGLVPVLEGRRLFRSLTIEENLVSGAIGAGLRSADIRRGLEEVYSFFPRLKERRQSRAGLTSGGEQQMAAIGRGLMARPQVFLLDEPSMGLAPLVVAEIFETLSRLNRETGLTILVAEQNSAVALKHAAHAVVIGNGRSTITGLAADLAQRDDIREAYLGGASAPA
ncbi:ABC transporter ATP-binding protein [Pseudogemmobacter humi]|uniref:High-affinity branched-chain amino acid transport ATP-binding protein LivF n=1 Tax=Pseudogemmobacter humi TaxID=2483812 RepID=A0A3P5WF13_9RHOB|nr:ABC transporter ATP-binding protein [Pseudogemmobacter humi]VDC19873.1 High-affinity branched-chain amino acid transport ATP-binding protein LivF [Pseudogemmobacter humi]